jgi:aspartate kinase
MIWEVHKFGGASLAEAKGFPRLKTILAERQKKSHILLVVSAIGKTTNSLEEVWSGSQDAAIKAQQALIETHLTLCRALLPAKAEEGLMQLMRRITPPENPDDQAYDNLVSMGEKCSSYLVTEFLRQLGLPAVLLPAEQAIRTDSCWRSANVDRQATAQQIASEAARIKAENPDALIVTQGFLGANSFGQTTTLGREGSDYSAALFAQALGAASMYIWKDVPGVMDGDPRIWPDAKKIEALSYDDATDMAYYGASVIHPKTMLPLKEAGIPLFVNSYDAPERTGTCISSEGRPQPARMLKMRQTLLELPAQPGFFAVEKALPALIEHCRREQCLINLLQHTADSVFACLEASETRLKALEHGLMAEGWRPALRGGLSLLTYRDAPGLEPEIPGLRLRVRMVQTLGRDRRFLLDSSPI